MNGVPELPLWAAIPVAFFLVLGSGLTVIGAYGFWRLRSFYDRIHAPTLGASWGTAAIVMASMIAFTVLEGRPVFREILIGIFVTATTPVTFMLLGRAALYRDRAENNPIVPKTDPPRGYLDQSSRIGEDHEVDGTGA